jgi:hypothetical protein
MRPLPTGLGYPPDSSNAHRERIAGWLSRLLDPACGRDEQIAITGAWLEDWLGFLGVDREAGGGFADDMVLSSGVAIAPSTAAACLTDFFRTTQFLRAMDAALHATQARFPGESIDVLEAGCGPLAPLSLPFAVRYPTARLRFTLLDANPLALEQAGRLAAHLGISRAVSLLQEDAATLTLPDRPHVIACEMIQRGLTREPQAAATLNLGQQLREGGVFLPEEITVRAGLFDAAARYGAGETGVRDFGPVARLSPVGLQTAEQVQVPPHDPHRSRLCLLTRIRVDETHVIDDFDAAITLPEPVETPPGFAEAGGSLRVSFDLGPSPGPRLS